MSKWHSSFVDVFFITWLGILTSVSRRQKHKSVRKTIFKMKISLEGIMEGKYIKMASKRPLNFTGYSHINGVNPHSL